MKILKKIVVNELLDVTILRLNISDKYSWFFIDYYRNIAKSQKEAFSDVYPWEDVNDKIHYIMISSSGILCAWMSVYIDKLNNCLLIDELTSRSSTDRQYRGCAYRLHKFLLEDVKNRLYGTIDFIYLIPFSDKVKEVYIKWGYKVCDKYHGNKTSMIYTIRSSPLTLLNVVNHINNI